MREVMAVGAFLLDEVALEKNVSKIPLAIPTLKWGGRPPKSWQFYAEYIVDLSGL